MLITYDPGMVVGVPPADRQKVGFACRINGKTLCQGGGTKLYAFAPVQIWKFNLAEYMPFYTFLYFLAAFIYSVIFRFL